MHVTQPTSRTPIAVLGAIETNYAGSSWPVWGDNVQGGLTELQKKVNDLIHEVNQLSSNEVTNRLVCEVKIINEGFTENLTTSAQNKEQLFALNARIRANEDKFKDWTQSTELLQASNASITKQVKEHKETIEKLAPYLNSAYEVKKEVDQHQTRIKRAENDNIRLSNVLENYREKTSDLETSLKSKDEELNGRINQINSDLKGDIKSALVSIDGLKNELKMQISPLEKSYEKITERSKKIQQETEAILQKCNEMNQESWRNTLKVQEDVKSMATQVKEDRDTVKAIEERLSALTSLPSRVDALENLSSRVDTLQREIQDLKSANAILSGQNLALQSKISAMEMNFDMYKMSIENRVTLLTMQMNPSANTGDLNATIIPLSSSLEKSIKILSTSAPQLRPLPQPEKPNNIDESAISMSFMS